MTFSAAWVGEAIGNFFAAIFTKWRNSEKTANKRTETTCEQDKICEQPKPETVERSDISDRIKEICKNRDICEHVPKRLANRTQLYEHLAARIEKSHIIFDVTLGVAAESLSPLAKEAREKYENMKSEFLKKRLKKGEEPLYRELFSYTKCGSQERLDLIKKAIEREDEYDKKYQCRILRFSLDYQIPNFCVCNGESCVHSFVSTVSKGI